jgi:hypothetical protein
MTLAIRDKGLVKLIGDGVKGGSREGEQGDVTVP